MLGNSAGAADVLNFAAIAVQFFDLKTAPEKAYEISRGDDLDARWRHFEELPVDVAMRDGGWKVLEYEYGRVRADSMELGEIAISEPHATYLELHCPAPGDKVQAESLAWLTASLRQDLVAIEFIKDVNFEIWQTDDD